MKHLLCHALLPILLISQIQGAEIDLEPIDSPLDSVPSGFKAYLAGKGKPGEWKVIMAGLPSAMQKISPLANNTNRKKVIGQFSESLESPRFPMLIHEGESFDDFELTSQVKILDGLRSQTLGIVFRWQDPNNYYSFRVDTMNGFYYFRKVVNGQEQEPLGNRITIKPDEWITLNIECKGPNINLSLGEDNKIPTLTDTEFKSGKIGYWTELDTTGYFGGTKIRYRPKIAPAQRLIGQIMEKYDRLVNVSIFASETDSNPPTKIAATDLGTIGQAADEAILDSIKRGKIYYKKNKKTVLVTLPVKDRNGESMAACRVELKRFRGQTQKNAIVRAVPVARMIQGRVLDREDLFE